VRFALIDLSNGAQTTDGGSLNPTVMAQIAEATNIQLNTHFSAEWGGNYAVRVLGSVTDLDPGEVPFTLLPTLSDAPGAIAYHSSNGNGAPLILDGVTLSDSINGPGNSVSVAVSHELLECAADPPCNFWADDQQSTEHALEVADPFESQAYQVAIDDSGTSVWVSNFALRSWFDPGAPSPYSYMARMQMAGATDAPGPLQLGAGAGYNIVRTYDPQSENSIFGKIVQMVGAPTRRPFAHALSRKLRRGVPG
jgi:hypothetical protein